MKIAICFVLLFLAACSGKKVTPEEACNLGLRACAVTAAACAADAELASKPVCIDREQYCTPLRAVCASLEDVES